MSLLLDALKQAERNKSKREVGRAMLESGQRGAAQPRRNEPRLDAADSVASTRQRAAQKLFSAKQSGRPGILNATTIIAAAVLALLIAMAVVYWWVMRPEMNEPALIAPRVTPGAVAAPAPGPVAPQATPPKPEASTLRLAAREPVAPAAPPASPGAAMRAARPAPDNTGQAHAPRARTQREREFRARSARRERPVVAAAQAPSGARRLDEKTLAGAAPAAIRLTPSAPEEAPDAELSTAYAALLRGDLVTAERGYQTVRAADRFSLDAELGLAAIAARRGDLHGAQDHYWRALELDPKNAVAIAGLAGLASAQDVETTRVASRESELKNHLAGQPSSPHLHFALGNEFASQGRWSEAQQAYFNAFSQDPDNPDYAYNVAVSLDHIRQGAAAAQYYDQALALSQARPSQFDRERVLTRIKELRQELGEAPREIGVPRQ